MTLDREWEVLQERVPVEVLIQAVPAKADVLISILRHAKYLGQDVVDSCTEFHAFFLVWLVSNMAKTCLRSVVDQFLRLP